MLKKLEILLLQLPQTTILKSSRLFGGSKKQALKEVKRHKSSLLYSVKSACKEVVSNRLGLVDFAIVLVNSVLNLPDGQVKFFEEFKLQKNCEINSAHQNVFGAS